MDQKLTSKLLLFYVMQFLENIKPVFTKKDTEMARTDFSDKNRESNVIYGMYIR